MIKCSGGIGNATGAKIEKFVLNSSSLHQGIPTSDHSVVLPSLMPANTRFVVDKGKKTNFMFINLPEILELI
jgi:hypothetical protein